MILQTLAEYYQEQAAAGNPDYAPQGMELKRIHFVLVLSSDGMLIDIEQPQAKLCVSKSRPRCGKDAPSVANRMWDSVGYVTGFGATEKLQVSALVQHRSFVEQVRELHRTHPGNRTFGAVAEFYSRHFEQLIHHALWQNIIAKTGHNLSFRLAGEELLASQQAEIATDEGHEKWGECMVTGHISSIARLHPKVYIHGGSPTGAKLVSFTKGCGYDSYHKRGGENAPISVEIAESYSAALTGLLQQDSGNSVIVGEVTFLFFTLPKSVFNDLFRTLIDPSVEAKRNEILNHIGDYVCSDEGEAEFVLIALVPNAARLSVRLHLRTTIGKLCKNILGFYQDIAIERNFVPADAIPLLLPLFAASPQSNIGKLSPQIIVDYLYAVATDGKFPVSLQNELLDRLREIKKENIGIVSMLRCYLNRNTNPKIYTPMALDRENRNTGYVLGRMFAILERTQEMASPGITFTLRDTYYAIASVTPSAVFNRLVALSSSFFRRIPKQGTAIFLKSQLGEVTDLLHVDGIPMRLSLDDQSRFALGYFHQRQTYFIKKEIQYEQDN